jgi:hypothetical protein
VQGFEDEEPTWHPGGPAPPPRMPAIRNPHDWVLVSTDGITWADTVQQELLQGSPAEASRAHAYVASNALRVRTCVRM